MNKSWHGTKIKLKSLAKVIHHICRYWKEYK